MLGSQLGIFLILILFKQYLYRILMCFFSIKINHQKLEIGIALFGKFNVPTSIKD
jgi:hypothetical protein